LTFVVSIASHRCRRGRSAVSQASCSWCPSWCACCSEPPTVSISNQRLGSDRGLPVLRWTDVLGTRSSIALFRSEVPNCTLSCSSISWFPLLKCPPRLSTVDCGLLKPLMRACVRGQLLCFLVDVLCSCARAAHASAHTNCGAGSDSSRVRSRYVCVTCKRCTAGCLGIKSGTVRAHFSPHDMI
jgi:hypothetical protein